MYYIDKKIIKRREVLFLQIIPTLVVFTAFMIATIFSWKSTSDALQLEQKQILSQRSQEITNSMQQKMALYEIILRNSAGLFSVTKDINRTDWKSYVSTLDLTNRYPGLQGIGYIQVVTKQEQPAFIQSRRSQGMPNFAIKPVPTGDLSAPVVFIEPSADAEQPIAGFDMLSEKKRAEALTTASTTGNPTVSETVELSQSKVTGFLLYMPLFKNVLDNSTAAPDGQARGFIYAPFILSDFISNSTPSEEEHYAFRIYSLQDNTESVIYESSGYQNVRSKNGMLQHSADVTFSGVRWRLEGVSTPDIVNQDARSQPSILLVSGMLFSVVTASFVYLLLGNRTKALEEKEKKSVQEAKDELLALASHQLRTPATGVKQYVGMLREGFAGTLDEMQSMLLDKAYESNERQLNTINEMLLVARADAGHLKMDILPFNISELISEIIEEQSQAIQDRQQTIKTEIPTEDIIVHGDKPYLRMALENILSNASKYTHEKGTISMTVTPHNDVVAIQVKDNGVGVSKKDQELLFKKFSRIPNELTNRVNGSGIGLYLTKKVIDQHGGRIVVQSKVGEGTTITVLLPRHNP